MPSKRGCTEMKAIHKLYEPKCLNRDLALQWTSKCPSPFTGTDDDRRPRLTG